VVWFWKVTSLFADGVWNISSKVMRCGRRGQEGMSKVLEIVSKVARQGEYIYVIRGFS